MQMQEEPANIVRNRRCCSFCRNPGHNITNCHDTRLKTFEHDCIIASIEISSLHGNNHISRDEFRIWLIDNFPDEHNIRALAIRKCRCARTTNIGVCINRIVEYVFTLLYIINYQHTTYLNPNNTNYANYANFNFEENSEATVENFIIDNVEASIQTAINLINTELNNNQDPRVLFNRVNMTLSAAEIMYYTTYYDMVNNPSGNYTSDYIVSSKKFNIKIDINNQDNNLEPEEKEEKKICECTICYDNIENDKFVKLNCNHEFCKDCLIKSLQNEERDTPCCAYCRAPIDTITLNKEEYKEEFMDIIL
jgi:hypothetical protein